MAVLQLLIVLKANQSFGILRFPCECVQEFFFFSTEKYVKVVHQRNI